MEQILPIKAPKSFDCYHDSLTHHYAAPVFYDALKREISFAKREGNVVGIMRFVLPLNATEDQLLFFANELELAVRQHDLIARTASHEFSVLLRFDSDLHSACDSLLSRIKNVEKREFTFAWIISDGTKGLVQVLSELDNPQIFISSNTL